MTALGRVIFENLTKINEKNLVKTLDKTKKLSYNNIVKIRKEIFK